MPQEMNVLRCYSCKMFQVHIVKKAKTWQCKICNEKQSFQRVFFKGSGKDCRTHVQKLNSLTHNELQDMATETSFKNCNEISYDLSDDNDLEEAQIEVTESKWTKYLEPSQVALETDSVESTKNEGDIFDNNDLESNYVHNDGLMQRYVEDNSNSDAENNLEMNVSTNCHDKKEDINETVHEQSDDLLDDNIRQEVNVHLRDMDVKKNIGKDKSIFDDHDDIDMSLDF